MRKILIAACAAFLGFMSTAAEAGFQYGFSCITNRNVSNASVGSQLKVDVIDPGWGNQVRFEFTNTGTKAGSITDIYFHDASNILASFGWVQNQTGVNFVAGANPATLSGGSAVGFVTDTVLNTESTSTAYGVNPGEKVGITLNLGAGKMFSDVVAAISTGAIRMGVQMTGFTYLGSESFVNTTTNTSPVPVTPEPSALALGGLACLGLLRRRRKPTTDVESV